MNKNILWLVALMVTCSLGFASCAEDTAVEDPYANWEARNDHYLDSIVDLARKNADGKWYCVPNYKIGIENGPNGGIIKPSGEEYTMTDSVYVHFYTQQETGEAPLFTDSVSVYYNGWLINNEKFDGNYQGDWKDEYTDEIYSPNTFLVQGVVSGWQTALMKATAEAGYKGMVPGDRADVHIPYQLAYGTSGSGSIRGYSVLKFHIKVEKVIHPKGPDDRKIKTIQTAN